jgi:hypothetical protein
MCRIEAMPGKSAAAASNASPARVCPLPELADKITILEDRFTGVSVIASVVVDCF